MQPSSTFVVDPYGLRLNPKTEQAQATSTRIRPIDDSVNDLCECFSRSFTFLISEKGHDNLVDTFRHEAGITHWAVYTVTGTSGAVVERPAVAHDGTLVYVEAVTKDVKKL